MAEFAPKLVEVVIGDGLDLIALNPAHAIQAALLDWDHRDPLDRLIEAVGLTEETDLVSGDAALTSWTRFNRYRLETQRIDVSDNIADLKIEYAAP